MSHVCLSRGRRVRAPAATHILVTLEETQGTVARSCSVQSTALPQHRHRSGKSSSPVSKQRGFTGGRAQGARAGQGTPMGWGRMPSPGEDGLQQASPSSSTSILPLLAASMSPKTCSQPLSSTAGQSVGTTVRGTRTSARSKNPGSLGRGCCIAQSLRSASSPTAAPGQNRESSSPVACLQVQPE